ncbi:MAG: uncharacterized protein QOJ38_1708 [Solirubrobacterales bacterium]|jgi:uncharacterized protein (TIGR01777 family)|nr:uncharacterized protein [Solirubrobacterales bacterium]
MRVLVTGASGLIGRHLCDALLIRGDDVVGLTREVRSARETNPRVNWHAWQAADEPPPAAALEGLDAVVNLVGEPINQRLTWKAKQRIRASRIDATRNLIEGLSALDEKARPGVFISQSAVGYYGDCGDALVDESTPAGGDVLAAVCQDWEQAGLGAAAFGMRTVITRTGHVLAADGGLLKALETPFRLGVGGPLAGGDQFMPWIHIEDAVAMLLWALAEKKLEGPLNLTSPNPVTNRELAKALGHALHRPSAIPAPKLALVLARGRELAEVLAGGQRVIPRRALDMGFEFRFTELEPALEDLYRER